MMRPLPLILTQPDCFYFLRFPSFNCQLARSAMYREPAFVWVGS
jgi:hypothetical protein